MKPIDEISGAVVGEAIRIHKALGPGLLERVYQTVLAGSLARLGFRVATEVPIPLTFEGQSFECGFRIDLLVDERLIVEIKSVEQLSRVHAKQVLTYLRLLEQPVGLLLNFSASTMTEGIQRLVNNHRPA